AASQLVDPRRMPSRRAKPSVPMTDEVPVTRGKLVDAQAPPRALIESRAEARVRAWFVDRKYSVCKGDDVDVEASFDGVPKHVVEVKGDQFSQPGPRMGQITPGALRNTFFMGLGQLLIARTRHKNVQCRSLLHKCTTSSSTNTLM